MPRNTNITYIPRIPDPDGRIPHLFTSSSFSAGLGAADTCALEYYCI